MTSTCIRKSQLESYKHMVRSHVFSLNFPMFVNQHTLKLEKAILLQRGTQQSKILSQEMKLVSHLSTTHSPHYTILYHYSEASLTISKTSSLNITDIFLDGIQTFNTHFSVMLKYIYIPESIEKTFYTIRRLVLKNFDTTFHLRRKEKVNICFLI